MLKVENLHARYGSIEALHGISLQVRDGEIACLIGANGAGKTTTLKSISGAVSRTGSIVFNEEELIDKGSGQVASRGIVHVPEGRLVFPQLSVEDNLIVGTVSWHGFFGHKPYQNELEQVYDLFPRLRERKSQKAWSLSGGEQQMLAIGRGLMAHPKLLMLDEPSMGLAPKIIDELFEKIVEINKKGISVLLIEQNAELAFEISNYAYVMSQGNIILKGKSEDVRNDERVKDAYLNQYATEHS
jgi:branched-chain amino acid transport system ATP-binding protein